MSWRTDTGQADTLCKGKNITQVLQKVQELEAASEVGEMMGSVEGEGLFTAAAGMRQEFTRNQISLWPQLTKRGYCSGYRARISMAALPAETVEAGWNHTGGI